ncbi:MAG TPA: hypothetical protein VFO11_03080 [Candidatus Polarisedimenticolaceae bacterium]|nr:hypothetical protein [Candidatus Polarisedimenticolaceae bacterium]
MILATALVAVLPLAAAAKPAEQKWDMTTFTLVLVRPGKPETSVPSGAAAGHQTLLRDLAAKKKAIAWGPIEGSPDLLEVIVLDVPKPEEATPLLASDPWFTSGARVMELHPWFAARGILQAPAEGAAEETITFGLLRRPPDAPQFPEEKLKEIQKGHMANIEAMAASGDLAIAGPLADDGTLRGVFVFRGTDQKHLRAIAAPDAAIQAGRLVLDLYTWKVAAGTLPAKTP